MAVVLFTTMGEARWWLRALAAEAAGGARLVAARRRGYGACLALFGFRPARLLARGRG
jgi:hypothetical protein